MKTTINKFKYAFLLITLLGASLSQAQTELICEDFEDYPINNSYVKSIGNWRVYNSNGILHPKRVKVVNDPDNGQIMTALDAQGATYLINTSDYSGDWTNYCSFCFDLKLISDGGNYSPPLDVSNSIFIFQGLNVTRNMQSTPPINPNLRFQFVLNNTHNETTGWLHICLPLRQIGSNDPLPSNDLGYWKISQIGTYPTEQAAWNAILTNVEQIGFFVDCTNLNQREVIGIDNICLSTECKDDLPLCCDIPDLDVSLKENNGSYILTINGGSVPIQEVEVSMMDYHAEYSNPDCKPVDMGMFGNLSSTTANLGTLVLDAASNNSQSLTWLPGSPSVLNSEQISFDVSKPAVLNLECCEVEFFYCLKVTVKDIDCNVCERIICFPSDTATTCITSATIGNVKCDSTNNQQYSFKLNINSNISGTLFPASTDWVLTSSPSIAPGSNTLSGRFLNPSNLPAGTNVCINGDIIDVNDTCHFTACFTIPECDSVNCQCGEWTDSARVDYTIVIVDSSTGTTTIIATGSADCGETVEDIALGTEISISNFTGDFICTGTDSCEAEYNWQIFDPLDGPIQNGSGKNINVDFPALMTGDYTLIITPTCGSRDCTPCVITFEVSDDCACGEWDSTKVTFDATTIKVWDDGTVTGVIAPQTITITPNLKCVSEDCPPEYDWRYTGPTSGSGTSIPIEITPTKAGTYTVTVLGWCGTMWCDSVRIFVEVDSVSTDTLCVTVVSDSVICLEPQGQNKRYRFTFELNNLTGQQCNLQIMPEIPGSGNISGVSPRSLPPGTTVVTGQLSDWVPANDPFCLRIICRQGTKMCEIVYCLPLPACSVGPCVLDPGMINAGNTFARRITLAQTFTPTQNGSLNKITHGLQSISGVTNYDLLVTTTTGGLPSWTGGTYNVSNVLYKVTGLTIFSNSAMVNAVVTISSGQPQLTAGTQYALILIPGTPTTGDMKWRGNTGASSYPTGSAYELVSSSWVIPTVGPKDHGFKLDGLCP